MNYGNDPVYAAALEGRLQLEIGISQLEDGNYRASCTQYGLNREFVSDDAGYASQKCTELILEDMKDGKAEITFG
jgi:hypothetical protein